MLFTQLPTELLIEICMSLHSLCEIRHLGLTCKTLHTLVLELGYQQLFRLLYQLEREAPTVANNSRKVMVARS